MNYFAHGSACLERPWELVGTALPDWLRRVDRRTRLPPAALPPWPTTAGRQLAEGIARHYEDDRRFHSAPRFLHLCARMVADLRGLHDHSPRFRASVVAHVLVEMLLDATLVEQDPGALDRYYQALGEAPPEELQSLLSEAVSAEIAGRTARALEQFRAQRFLEDYAHDDGLHRRLHGALGHLRLGPWPDELPGRLPTYRNWLRLEATPLMAEVRDPQNR